MTTYEPVFAETAEVGKKPESGGKRKAAAAAPVITVPAVKIALLGDVPLEGKDAGGRQFIIPSRQTT